MTIRLPGALALDARLLETMRAENGDIAHLGRHLDRLSKSATRLGYPLDRVEADRLARSAALRAAPDTARVRLTLGPRGDLDVIHAPLLDTSFETAWIDPLPLAEAGTPRCTLKTTDRDHYATRLDRARAVGADEAILVNAQGEVTEGTRTNVWADIDGRLWTPPSTSGGLPGVLRAHLIATDARAGERVLTPADLWAAEALFLSNAVRGLMRVHLVEGSPGTPLGDSPDASS